MYNALRELTPLERVEVGLHVYQLIADLVLNNGGYNNNWRGYITHQIAYIARIEVTQGVKITWAFDTLNKSKNCEVEQKKLFY
jgi:hypothetical protein